VIWKHQFEAVRDGDRFFYRGDRALAIIRQQYGIDYRRTLAGLIHADTGAAVQANVFKAPAETTAPTVAPASVAVVTRCGSDRNSHGLLSPTSGRS
jgi:hypothetical protein